MQLSIQMRILGLKDLAPRLAKLRYDLFLGGTDLQPTLLANFLAQRRFPTRFVAHAPLVVRWRPPEWREELMDDLAADPLEQHDLASDPALREDRETRQARGRLQRVLDSLPPDATLPFEFRSISVRKIRAEEAARGARERPEKPR